MSKQIDAQDSDKSNTNNKLRKLPLQTDSTSSIDSGLSSCQLSPNSSVTSMAEMAETEVDSCLSIPTITVHEAQVNNESAKPWNTDDASKVASDALTDQQMLTVHSRRSSNSSSLSDFHTAPNSPCLTRSTSLDSISSTNSANSPVSCQNDHDFYLPQTFATQIEKSNDNSICVTVAMPSQPVEVELVYTQHSLTVTSKEQIVRTTTMTNDSPCKLTVKISNKLTSLQFPQVPLVSKTTKSMEKKIKEIVTGNLIDFRNHTNLDALAAHLISAELLSVSDYERLQATPTTQGKMNHFYFLILPKKGKHAYERFFNCLKNETSHSGHHCLVTLIQQKL